VPSRRCVGCGIVAAKSELTRIAIGRHADGERPRAVVDASGTMPGRGAYLCTDAAGRPAAACVAGARRRGAFARALRVAVALDDEIVESVGR
jgi:predicted RNA-binding protein YlxR (DUF448 family)